MKNRELYLKKLLEHKDSDLIKIITGVRRCGKSSLLILFKDYLLKKGVNKNKIIEINFESLEYSEITNYKALYDYIKNKITSKKDKYYILLDEIQEVAEWEKALRSFRVDFNCDLYVTGSNAYLLSGELATYLSGRCIQIKMLPLSFKEYLSFYGDEQVGLKLEGKDLTFQGKKLSFDNKEQLFKDYLMYGGLPSLANLKQIPNVKTDYLKDIYDMVLKRDVIARNNITDVGLLEKVVRYISQNIGSPVSSKKISDYLTSSGNPTTHNTVDNYLNFLENAYIIYKISRYDIKGKSMLKTLGKYYIVDTGIRNAIIGYRDSDMGHILENIVYLELIRRGYEVNIGKNKELEVDFIAINHETKKYYQVAYILTDENINREVNSLLTISDNYEKILISTNKDYILDKEGIKLVNIIDFLLEE